MNKKYVFLVFLGVCLVLSGCKKENQDFEVIRQKIKTQLGGTIEDVRVVIKCPYDEKNGQMDYMVYEFDSGKSEKMYYTFCDDREGYDDALHNYTYSNGFFEVLSNDQNGLVMIAKDLKYEGDETYQSLVEIFGSEGYTDKGFEIIKR